MSLIVNLPSGMGPLRLISQILVQYYYLPDLQPSQRLLNPPSQNKLQLLMQLGFAPDADRTEP